MGFEVSLRMSGQVAQIELSGDLDASSAPKFKEMVELAAARAPKRLVLMMRGLRYMASAGLRVLIFAKQKMGAAAEIVLVGTQAGVLQTLTLTGFHRSVVLVDEFPEPLALQG